MARQLFVSSLDPGRGNFHYYYLPKGLLTVSLKQLDADGNLELALTPKIVPDPDHRYYLQYTNTGKSNDKVDITFTEEGYLASVSIETEDVTLQVIENVIQSVKDMVGPPTPRGLEGATFPVELMNVTIDPFDQDQVDDVVKQIAGTKEEPGLDPDFSLTVKSFSKKKQKGLGTGDHYGILCKPIEQFEAKYKLKGTIKADLIKLPHPDVVHLVSVPNAPFVKSTLNITFGPYGQPTNIKIDQPSWWLAASQMPGKLIKGLFELPSQLVQLRVNYLNDQTGAKKQLEEAQQKLKAQEALIAAARLAEAEAAEGEEEKS